MKLKEARIQKRLSQRALAQKAGVTQSTIVLIEKGKSFPQFVTMNKIEKALGRKIDWPIKK